MNEASLAALHDTLQYSRTKRGSKGGVGRLAGTTRIKTRAKDPKHLFVTFVPEEKKAITKNDDESSFGFIEAKKTKFRSARAVLEHVVASSAV